MSRKRYKGYKSNPSFDVGSEKRPCPATVQSRAAPMSEFPQTFDRFEVSRILGKGGMGTVYLARDARLDRLVAIKVLNPDDLATEERRLRFLREAKNAASIRHPNVA